MVSPIASEFVKVLGGVFVLSFITACTCSNDITTPREVDPTTTASLRCIVASPDAPEIMVIQNDRPLQEKISRLDSVAPYVSLPSGIRNIRFVGIRSSEAYLSTNLDLGADRRYTYVTFDRSDRMRGVVMYDLVPLATFGIAHVRLVHVADSTGPIQFTVNEGPAGLPVSYPTAGEYLPVAQGSELALDLQDGGGIRRIDVPNELTSPGGAITIVVDRENSTIRTRWFRDR